MKLSSNVGNVERHLKNSKKKKGYVFGEKDLPCIISLFDLFTRTFSHQITIKEYKQL